GATREIVLPTWQRFESDGAASGPMLFPNSSAVPAPHRPMPQLLPLIFDFDGVLVHSLEEVARTAFTMVDGGQASFVSAVPPRFCQNVPPLPSLRASGPRLFTARRMVSRRCAGHFTE